MSRHNRLVTALRPDFSKYPELADCKIMDHLEVGGYELYVVLMPDKVYHLALTHSEADFVEDQEEKIAPKQLLRVLPAFKTKLNEWVNTYQPLYFDSFVDRKREKYLKFFTKLGYNLTLDPEGHHPNGNGWRVTR